MTSFHLKLIAAATMLIDHIGFVFFPQSLIFTVIGRLSFPLFAWLIANGSLHTRNTTNYAWRLFIFALISQWPYMLMTRLYDQSFGGINIMGTLFLGLGTIAMLKRTENKIIRISSIIAASIAAQVLHVDYGMVGVLSIVVFYVYRSSVFRMVLFQTMLFTIPSLGYLFLSNTSVPGSQLVQPAALISLLLIALHNGKEGTKISYYLYAFYPAHILLLYLIRCNQYSQLSLFCKSQLSLYFP